MSEISTVRRRSLLASISALALAAPSLGLAQAEPTDIGELIVTATRREATVQDVPINIAAVGGEQIEARGLQDLTEVSRGVAGVHLVDQGGRGSSRIVVRGLNADPLSSNDGDNSGGSGTVATYVGEIPLYVDLKLVDIERVEFLLGPQGTLYGAGTLAGAIRYIPTKPRYGVTEAEFRGDSWVYSHGDGISYDASATLNISPLPNLAIRASLGQLEDQGFIDYRFTVRESGVSDADPNFANPAAVAANLRNVKDANTESTTYGRIAVRAAPVEWLDLTGTYYFQFQDVGARQISGRRLTHIPTPIGKYESALRFVEPNSRDNELFALEATFDLGFAELTSASGHSRYDDRGQRDQTDLLLALEYSYEAFPTFSAFTLEEGTERTYNQEFRLVSKHDGPFSWIVGGFYNRFKSRGSSSEFTPGYPDFIGVDRPDNLEFFSVGRVKLEELAAYGEVTYEFNEQFSVTVGGRYYDYDLKTEDAVDFPLFNGTPDQVILNFEENGQKDDGFLGKINLSYEPNDDFLFYGTISEGYRIGNANGVGPCPAVIPPNQQLACALPDEIQYKPDKTRNYELGAKTQWLDKRLTVNAAVFYIDWTDVQVASSTVNGAIPITKNGDGARSQGVEVNFDAVVSENWRVQGSYSYTDAQLTDLAPDLIRTIIPPGFSTDPAVFLDGESGDRLPGSPKHLASLQVIYDRQVTDDLNLEAAWSAVYIGEVLSRTGGKGGGITLPDYMVHDLRIGVTSESGGWRVMLYADNVFDEYVEANARGTPLSNQVLTDAAGGPVYVRGHYVDVAPPRQVGIRVSKTFGGS